MDQSPFKKGFPWLSAGVLLFFVAFVLYLYDDSRTDLDILQEIQTSLQEDFDACLRYYNLDSVARTQVPQPACVACELTYDELGKLVQWNQNEYLPTQNRINRLRFKDEPLLEYENRVYYQVRVRNGPNIHVTLIPLHITYSINNEFLIPFVFLGRWQQEVKNPRSSSSFLGIEDLRAMRVYTHFTPNNTNLIEITDHAGKHVFSIGNMPTKVFRFRIRAAVVLFFILGFLAICIYLRIYALHHWSLRYYINLGLLLGVLLFRMALWYTNLPAEYIDIELFSPNILAFQEFIAPSLGELTINIITLAVIVGILYTHFFRLLNLAYRKIINGRIWAWPMAIFSIVASSLLLWLFVNFFRDITVNSQVDIAFSNLFKASIYSFIILLDVGILLLSIVLIIISLLKFNVLFGQRERYGTLFTAVHLISLLGINLFLHKDGNWQLALIVSVCLGLLFYAIYRLPFRPILHYGVVNYFLLLLSFSILVTYCVVVGMDQSNQAKVERIANSILGSQQSNTVFTYETVISNMESDQKLITLKYHELKGSNAFSQYSDWLKDHYFAPKFTQFDVWLYVYDTQNNRLDRNKSRPPTIDPNSGISIQDRAEVVNEEGTLYQMPNNQNRYLDLYIGTFEQVFDGDTLRFLLELAPTRLETEGLYPSLSLDQVLYEDIKLINSFDHAVYREGILYSSGGETAFPLYLDNYEAFQVRTTREGVDENGKSYIEFIEPIDNKRVVIVRYRPQDFFQIVTTFSFIFYFFSAASLLLVVLPLLAIRTLKSQSAPFNVPLRAKIRLGLIGISILPMFVIIAFLSPFISNRYEAEAKRELSNEAKRIKNALESDYLLMRNDALRRLTPVREFEERVRNLANVVRNDVNVFDEDGRRIASTQPVIYESGLSSDLMNATALNLLKDGQRSELVINERVGRMDYLSGYHPIVGAGSRPIGYVNIPYLARQDQLNEQVLDFLAYLSNIYLLVFLVINFVAILMSNTITQPLSLIQQRLSATSLGHTNKPIKYESKDEIGAIVTAYNQMLEKLEDSERKLTQSQRELAWRQMARQVAHEIKNPLTPMRLSIQHLERAWKSQSSNLEKMFPRVMKTLMVQIDSLVRIANSFHEFAKMPDPVKDRFLLNDVLLEVVDLYAQSEEATWLIDVPQEKFYVYSDRDQLSRCFNNIIKNGLQAIDENGTIHIAMRIENRRAIIDIKDNGKGMSEEVQKKVFEPNFSTKTSGMGLGLAIVRRIIESSGGSITFKSKLNEGTTFTIVLP
ncbi:MAG: sensor histidine kinase, partial [Bacteroidetes bacterium]